MQRNYVEHCSSFVMAFCSIVIGGCAANHPERTWPPELDISCEQPEAVGRTTAIYASLSNSRGGPYIVNPPYAIDASGARVDSLDVGTAIGRAGGADKLVHGLSELPSAAAGAGTVSADVTALETGSMGMLTPAVPFYIWRKSSGDLARPRIELGTFGHSYHRKGGALGCPCEAASDEKLNGYVFLPAGKYNTLYVEVDDPNLVARSVTAKCTIY
jgi:hypothetical protein